MKNLLTVVCCFLFVGGLISGCSSDKLKTWPVEGTVTLDGQPLDDGIIRFQVKEGGRPAYGAIKNGEYKIQTPGGPFEGGTLPGEYQVTLSRLVAPKVAPKIAPDGTVDEPEAKESLHKTYTNPETTPFVATVVKGKNMINFELKSTP